MIFAPDVMKSKLGHSENEILHKICHTFPISNFQPFSRDVSKIKPS